MDDSVLEEIKKLLGSPIEDDSFDLDLRIYINSLLLILSQLGISLIEGATVEDAGTTWGDLIDPSTKVSTVSTIKMYISAKVRKMFDPPQSGTAMQALDAVIAEAEWRLNVAVDPAN